MDDKLSVGGSDCVAPIILQAADISSRLVLARCLEPQQPVFLVDPRVDWQVSAVT